VISEQDALAKKMSRTVLAVDDDSSVLLTLKALLAPFGFQIHSYNDPEKALNDFKPDFYDLLILDVNMPKLNGFELYRLIRKIDATVKACFLTGLDDFSDFVSFKKEVHPKLNEIYFVKKPVTGEDLLERIDYMTSSHDINYTTYDGRRKAHLMM
jgi:FixJ family two-component response regulator